MAASGLEQLIGILLGAAFGVRAFDSSRAWWARAAYGAVGVDLLMGAFKGRPAFEPAGVGDVDALSSGQTSDGQATIPLKFEARRARTIEQRVAYIHEQMIKGTRNPKVYALARALISRKCGGEWCIPERDSLNEIRALFAEVRSRVRYTLDPVDFDAFQTPNKTLALKTGDCDDQVSLLGAMCRSIGYPVQSRIYHTKGFETWNHIAMRVRLPNKKWMTLDPTVNQPAGWEVPESAMLQAPKDFDVQERGA